MVYKSQAEFAAAIAEFFKSKGSDIKLEPVMGIFAQAHLLDDQEKGIEELAGLFVVQCMTMFGKCGDLFFTYNGVNSWADFALIYECLVHVKVLELTSKDNLQALRDKDKTCPFIPYIEDLARKQIYNGTSTSNTD